MKQKIFIFCALILITYSVNSQTNEFQFFSYRISLIHKMFHPQPGNPVDNYVAGPDNQLHQLISVENILFDYNLSFGCDVFYHFDFHNDKMGITTGLSFLRNKYHFNYSTDVHDFKLIDSYITTELGIPLFFKYDPKSIFKKMRFAYGGLKMNYILVAKNKNNYLDNTMYKLKREELIPIQFSLTGGFNFCILNFEIEYFPTILFNRSFQNLEGSYIYSSIPKNYFTIKTAIHLCPSNMYNKTLPFVIPKTKAGRFINRLFNCF